MKTQPRPCQNQRTRPRVLLRGFTLIELVVVMAVLGVLATLVMPMAEMTVQRDRERELKRALWEIRDAIDAYQRAVARGVIARPTEAAGMTGPIYPPTLLALTSGAADLQNPGRKIYFLRRVPRDPFTDPALPAERTWGLRSFQSPPDRPSPGDDVYDVFSTTQRLALDGTPLRSW